MNTEATRPNVQWGLEMTTVLVEGFGWVSIGVVRDGSTKVIVGYDAGIQCPAKPWLEALDQAVNGQFPNAARDQARSLRSDNSC